MCQNLKLLTCLIFLHLNTEKLIAQNLFPDTIPQKANSYTELFESCQKSITIITTDIPSSGTGFYLGVKATGKIGEHKVSLCTAKHVIQNAKKLSIRLNLNNGESSIDTIKLIYNGQDKNTFIHSDPSVDLAVVLVTPSKNCDFSFIMRENILQRTDYKKYKFGIGSEVYFSGFFDSYSGKKRMQTMFRFGNISLIPEDKISFDQNDLYLKIERELLIAELTTHSGNSGAPVFYFYENKTRIGLAGIVLGSYGSAEDLIDGSGLRPFKEKLRAISNKGLSAITPAELFNKIFDDKEFIKQISN